MDARQAKQALRREIAAAKKRYAAETLADWSERIASRLETHPLFAEATCVALYHALPGEVQTSRLLERWHERKRIALPVVQGDDLLLLPYTGADSVRPGAFGILEPVARPGSRSLEAEIDLLVVPGVAFDRRMNRLGRGRGFYDRLLSTLDVPRIGICFDFQLFDAIPTEDFDRKMDGIVTERESLFP